jgi:PAS domain S-box-containing protein
LLVLRRILWKWAERRITSGCGEKDMVDLEPERWALDLIEGSPLPSVLSNPRLEDNPIIACNQAFVDMTLYPREEIIGRNARFLSGPETEPSMTRVMRDGIRDHRPTLVELLNYKKDGTPFHNAVFVSPLFAPDDEEELLYYLGSQVELHPDAPGPSLSRRVCATQAVRTLSKRQVEVLRLVANGLRNKQIAYQLGLTEKTVKMHRAITMERLGTRTAAEMIRLAVEAGL